MYDSSSACYGVLQCSPNESMNEPCLPLMPVAGCVPAEQVDVAEGGRPPVLTSTCPSSLPPQLFDAGNHSWQPSTIPTPA